MKSSSRTKVVCLLAVFGFAAVGYAQETWKSKPFSQWSRGEAESILNNSPWASRTALRMNFDKKTQKVAGNYGVVDPLDRNPGNIKDIQASTDIPVDFQFTLRLRSALPVRQAVARLKQLDTDVEKLNAKDLAAFDTQIKGLIDCPACESNYVITLSSKSSNSPGADAVYTSFKGGRLADMQRYVFIANEHGEQRALVHFVAPKVPGDEAIFFFPRLDARGVPLLTPENKELIVNLSDNEVNSVANFKIDVTKIVVNGRVEF